MSQKSEATGGGRKTGKSKHEVRVWRVSSVSALCNRQGENVSRVHVSSLMTSAPQHHWVSQKNKKNTSKTTNSNFQTSNTKNYIIFEHLWSSFTVPAKQ